MVLKSLLLLGTAFRQLHSVREPVLSGACAGDGDIILNIGRISGICRGALHHCAPLRTYTVSHYLRAAQRTGRKRFRLPKTGFGFHLRRISPKTNNSLRKPTNCTVSF